MFKFIKFNKNYYLLGQWFSNCVPRHLGVPSEILRVPQIFFDKSKYLIFSIEILADFSIKNGSILFIIKNKPIFYTNSKKASHSNGF
jgi:hypothetical protein